MVTTELLLPLSTLLLFSSSSLYQTKEAEGDGEQAPKCESKDQTLRNFFLGAKKKTPKPSPSPTQQQRTQQQRTQQQQAHNNKQQAHNNNRHTETTGIQQQAHINRRQSTRPCLWVGLSYSALLPVWRVDRPLLRVAGMLVWSELGRGFAQAVDLLLPRVAAVVTVVVARVFLLVWWCGVEGKGKEGEGKKSEWMLLASEGLKLFDRASEFSRAFFFNTFACRKQKGPVSLGCKTGGFRWPSRASSVCGCFHKQATIRDLLAVWLGCPSVVLGVFLAHASHSTYKSVIEARVARVVVFGFLAGSFANNHPSFLFFPELFFFSFLLFFFFSFFLFGLFWLWVVFPSFLILQHSSHTSTRTSNTQPLNLPQQKERNKGGKPKKERRGQSCSECGPPTLSLPQSSCWCVSEGLPLPVSFSLLLTNCLLSEF